MKMAKPRGLSHFVDKSDGVNTVLCVGISVELVLLLLSPLEELDSNLLEECKREKVLILLLIGSNSLTERVDLGCDLVGGSVIHDVGITDDLPSEIVCNGSGTFSVLTSYKTAEFLGNSRVSALVGKEDVVDCLSTDDLRGGSYERRITRIGSYVGNLLENLVELVGLSCHLKLRDEVGKHSAGNLITESVNVNLEDLGVDKTGRKIVLSDLVEVLRNNVKEREIKTGVVGSTLEGSYERLGGSVRRAHRERRNCGVNTVNACLDSLEKSHRAETGSVVSVKMNGNLYAVLDGLDQLICLVGLEKTRHILDADGVCAHLLELLCILREALVGVEGRRGVGDSRLNVSALLDSCLDSGLEVSCIVQRVKDTEDIDTVCNGLLYEVLNNVVRIVTVTENVLSAEEHLKLRVLAVRLDGTESLPRILVEETETGIEGGTAPSLEGIISNLIHYVKDGNHFFCSHTRCGKRLMRITEDCFCNQYF